MEKPMWVFKGRTADVRMIFHSQEKGYGIEDKTYNYLTAPTETEKEEIEKIIAEREDEKWRKILAV